MKKILLLFLITSSLGFIKPKKQFITRNGQVTFFSYASAENIKAENNETLSLLDAKEGKIAVNILMRAFEFEKSLMQEHFNDSYIESDILPLKIKSDIEYKSGSYTITGETSIDVKDFKIKIPQILSSKIAKTVKIKFNFKYEPYEK